MSGWYDGRILEREPEAEWDAVLPHLTLLRDLGCRHVVYADTSRRAENDLWGPISRRPRLATEDWPGYGRKLTALAERMASFGVAMAFHHHMGTIVETDEEVGLLMRHTGRAVNLLYDTGHCVFAGGDPGGAGPPACRPDQSMSIARTPGLKSWRGRKRPTRASCRPWSTACSPCRATESVDYPAILRILADHGYSGWLVVEAEQDPQKAHPLTYAKLGFCNLARLALQAGFTIAP